MQLGKGESAELVVHEHDDPQQLAAQFCQHFKLSAQLESLLHSQILEQLAITSARSSMADTQTESLATFTPEESVSSARSKPFSNVGEKLYFKGIKMKERRRMLALKQQQENEEAVRPPRSTSRSHRETHLLKKGQEYKENRDRQRGRVLAQQMQQCTFTPQIKHYGRTTPAASKHLELYTDARKREQGRTELSEN